MADNDPDAADNPARAGAARKPLAPPQVPDHELLRPIGQGSYGEVWLARNALGQYRAVKLIRRQRFDSERPFDREFSGIQRFEPLSRSHEGLVDILQVGRNDQAGYFCYVMEVADSAEDEVGPSSNPQVEGPTGHAPGTARARPPALSAARETFNAGTYHPKTLAGELRRRGRLPVDECLDLGLLLASALGQLHRHGLVHRDIKPSNIIFVHGAPKLADIGLVASLTETRSFVGTEGFIPPEGPGTAAADLYSLGKVLYEISTGRDRQDFPQLSEDFRAWPDMERARFAEFNEVLLRSCQADPRRRYQSTEEMHADLALLRSGKSLQHVRRMERRLALVTRAVVAVAILAAVGLAGSLIQQAQSRKFQRLAQANRAMAEENRRLAEESRAHLVGMQVANGQRFLEAGDPLAALPWLAEALKLVQGQPEKEAEHGLRLAGVVASSPRLLQLWRHAAAPNSAVFSPDGRRVLTVSFDQTARVWDTLTGQPLTPPLQHQGEVKRGLFSPDGGELVTIGADGLKVWDAQTGTLRRACPHPNNLSCLAFSPDGGWLAVGCFYGRVKVWHYQSGLELFGPWGQKGQVFSLSFSPDSRRLLVASWDGKASLWDLDSGTLVFELAHKSSVHHAEFSPDGQRIATAEYERAVHLWDAQTGQELLPPLAHDGPVYHAEFSLDGARLLSASADKTVALWNPSNGLPAGPVLRHNQRVLEARFTPDGRQVLTRDAGGAVQLWDAATGRPAAAPLRHGSTVRSAVLHADGHRVLTACEDGTVRLWDWLVIESSEPPWPEPRKIIALSRQGTQLAAQNAAKEIEVWDTARWARAWPPLRPDLEVAGASVSDDGTRLLLVGAPDPRGGNRRTVQALELPEGRLQASFQLPASASGYRMDPKGVRLISLEDKALRGWSLPEGRLLWGPRALESRPTVASFSPAGWRFLVACAARVHILDAATGQDITEPLAHPDPLSHAAFSSDGSWVVTTCGDWTFEERQARLWDADTGRLQAILLHKLPVWHAAFSPDGRCLATGSSDQTARVWEVPRGRPISPPLPHGIEVSQVAFSRDGRWLATGAADGQIRLWDWQTGQLLLPPLRQEPQITGLSFLADGFSLVARSESGTNRLWRFRPPTLPANDWILLAGLLSAHELDQTGALVPISAERLARAFAALSPRMAGHFRPAAAEER